LIGRKKVSKNTYEGRQEGNQTHRGHVTEDMQRKRGRVCEALQLRIRIGSLIKCSGHWRKQEKGSLKICRKHKLSRR